MVRANYKICPVCHTPITRVKRTICYGTGRFIFTRNTSLGVGVFSSPDRYKNTDKKIPRSKDAMAIICAKSYISAGNRTHFKCKCYPSFYLTELPNNSDPKTLAKFSKQNFKKKLRYRT